LFFVVIKDLHPKPIEDTQAYKYLQGDKDEFIKYTQFNYVNNDNEKRLLDLKASIK
jgi:hypothetical protein